MDRLPTCETVYIYCYPYYCLELNYFGNTSLECDVALANFKCGIGVGPWQI